MASKPKLPWWKRFFRQALRNLKIVTGEDDDFGEDVKLGFKTKVRF